VTPTTLPFRHLLLALAVIAVWGTNFVVIRYALDDLPPLLFAALRFTLVVIPAIFFFRRPDVPWRHLISYGLFIGAGQFGLLFLAIKSDIAPGLASLVVQTQVFFTIGLAMWFSGERVKLFQLVALLIAATGLGIILMHTDKSTTPLGLALVLGAALSWACGNHIVKQGGKVNMVAYVVWSSIFAVPPLFLASVVFEGSTSITSALAAADATTWSAVLWQSAGNSLFGYAAWGWLLARYPAATISPLALMIPIFGMGATALLLQEPMPLWKILAAALVIGGMALNIFWPVLKNNLRQKTI
jgi:O-acetylserine/cysteine efflux transporter